MRGPIYWLWNLAEHADYEMWWPRRFWGRVLRRIDRYYGYYEGFRR